MINNPEIKENNKRNKGFLRSNFDKFLFCAFLKIIDIDIIKVEIVKKIIIFDKVDI